MLKGTHGTYRFLTTGPSYPLCSVAIVRIHFCIVSRRLLCFLALALSLVGNDEYLPSVTIKHVSKLHAVQEDRGRNEALRELSTLGINTTINS